MHPSLPRQYLGSSSPLGVLELENGRYYLPGHKPSDRQGQPQDYGRRIAPPKVYYDPSVIDERFAKKREAELKNEGFDCRT
jgi:hypothetical protein